MSKLRIKILTPPSPYRTYLEERLQSARGLGWPCTEARGATEARDDEAARDARPAITPPLKPA